MSPWHWLILGVLLALIEVFAPGFLFLWLGIGATLTAALVWLAPGLPWQAQALAFACLALLSVLGWFAWRRRHPDQPIPFGLNRRAAQQVGALGSLIEPLQGGRGRIRLGDSSWPATGPDLPVGTRVRVARVENGRLVVEPADNGRPDA
jgi:membrane protein implicated in regulation of membrane protease activity